MKFAGCDLHKQTITVCVVDQSRQVLARRRLLCADEATLTTSRARPSRRPTGLRSTR